MAETALCSSVSRRTRAAPPVTLRFDDTVPGAPDLSEIGAEEGKDQDYFVRYVGNPAQFGNQVMPAFLGLGEENLKAIGAFLAASKGEK